MRVFILCTGRSGSTTIIEACKHISNYTCGHESLSNQLGYKRFNYPDNHIEADNRLSWFLGSLDEIYGNDAFYVHLIREKEDTIKSFNNRWEIKVSIIKAFRESILMIPDNQKISEKDKLQISDDYYNTVNANIKFFLKDKNNKFIIKLENLKEDFNHFWHYIKAEGDLEAASLDCDIAYNKNQEKIENKHSFLDKFKRKTTKLFKR